MKWAWKGRLGQVCRVGEGGDVAGRICSGCTWLAGETAGRGLQRRD
jgi:hypothetical protein